MYAYITLMFAVKFQLSKDIFLLFFYPLVDGSPYLSTGLA